MTAWYNGSFIDPDTAVIPIQERGHQFGDGIYEVIRVYSGMPFAMEDHLDRLEKSAAAVRLTLPMPREELEALLLEALERSGGEEAEIYLQITRGIHPRNHAFPKEDRPALSIIVSPARVLPEEEQENGIRVITTEDKRWTQCWIKSLNLLPNVLAKQEAVEQGAREALLIRDGIVTEGSSTNVFLLRSGTLYTHPATEGILHGITRDRIIRAAAEADIPVVEETFTTDALFDAEEVFITSTTLEAAPVCEINGRTTGSSFPGTMKLRNLLQQQIRKEQNQ
ncbi:D-amino-acid transaminase [Alkalicoccus urumqiensis]|nr:D-amino-acid transaminase [Alkalicoccus urumqiensis]